MDNEASDSTASVIKLASSISKAGGKGRLMATAEQESLLPGNRSDWAARWQHPLVKSIQMRRRKSLPILSSGMFVEVILAGPTDADHA